MGRPRRDLTEVEAKIFRTLVECAKADRPTPRAVDICRQNGLNTRTPISRVFDDLEAAGLIVVEQDGKYTRRIHIPTLGISTRSTVRVGDPIFSPEERGSTATFPYAVSLENLLPLEMHGKRFDDAADVPEETGVAPRPQTYVLNRGYIDYDDDR